MSLPRTDPFPFHLLPWFFAYVVLAILMVGVNSLALGAACNDARDAQNLTRHPPERPGSKGPHELGTNMKGMTDLRLMGNLHDPRTTPSRLVSTLQGVPAL